MTDWHSLPDRLQLLLAREALRAAMERMADHAEDLAREMEAGALADRGGPDALRLLASLIQIDACDGLVMLSAVA